jgi:hypothetical protein
MILNKADFPSDFVSTSEKETEEYGIQYFNAAWNYFGGWSYYNSRQLLFENLRRFGMGMQSVEQMKDYFSSVKQGDIANMNMDWTPPAIVATYRDRIIKRILNVPYRVQCRAIDPMSTSKKEKERNTIAAKMKLQADNEYFKEQYGVPIFEDTELPKDEGELDIFMELEYKLASEIAMTAAIDWSFYKSNEGEIKRQVAADCVDIGIAALAVEYDEKMFPMIRVVDPHNLITPYSYKPDYSDINFAFEIRYKTIAQIKKESGFSEPELENIAKTWRGSYGNERYKNQNRYFRQNNFSAPYYYNFLVPVMVGGYLSLDSTGYESYETYKGRKRVTKKGVKKANDIKAKEIGNDVQNLYTGSWIVGTSYIYNYGLAENMLRTRKDGKLQLTTQLPVVIYQADQRDMQSKSLVERMIMPAEQMHLAMLKIQQELAMSPPSGYEIDIDAISGVLMGQGQGEGTPSDPLEIIKVWTQTGRLFVNKNKDGYPQYQGAAATPMGGVNLTAIQAEISVFQFHKQFLEDSIGGSSVANTGSPSPDALVGIQKMAAIASDNALGTTIHGYTSVLENTAKLCAAYIQNVAEHKEIEVYAKGLGDNYVRAIKFTKDDALCEYGIKVEYAPQEEQKFILSGYIKEALAIGAIELPDAYILETQYKDPNLAYAYLRKRMSQFKKEKAAEQQALSQQNAEVQTQAGQAVEQSKQQTFQMQAEAKMAEIAAQAEVDDEKAEREHYYRMEEIKLKGSLDIQLANVVGQQKEVKTFQSSDLVK